MCLRLKTDINSLMMPMAGKIITVAQQKGGAGKTTIAANLAVALSRMGKTVSLLDTDPQGSLGRWFMTRRENGDPGMGFSTASAWGVSYECDKLRKTFDFVLVDTPPKIDSDLKPAIRESDLVIAPVSASQRASSSSIMRVASATESQGSTPV